jgi:hypothetical protein
MSYHPAHRRKPIPSAHQKQMRFLTGLSLAFYCLLFITVLWLVNRPSFYMR